MEVLYKGPRFEVKRIDNWDVVEHPGAVVILPLLDPHTLAMIKNRRRAVGEVLWELPAGTLEVSELPLICAKRELEEETGFKAKTIRPLLEFYTSPGFCNEKMYAFVAEDLSPGKPQLEAHEEISVEKIKWTDALEMIRKNQIVDAKTLLTLLYYALY
jgi:ADP-ribose pyrophosphatase